MSYKHNTPSLKGIKAASEAVKNILEGSNYLTTCLNVFSTAAADNHIPIDQQSFQEATDLLRTLNRLMQHQKADLEHRAANIRVEAQTRRSIRAIRRQAGFPSVINMAS